LRKKKRYAWLALLLAFGLVAAACGDDDDTSSDSTSDDGGDGGDCPTDVEMGSTVDEPEMFTSPSVSAGQSPEPDVPSVEDEEASSSPPHAAAMRPNASSRANQANRFFLSKGVPSLGEQQVSYG